MLVAFRVDASLAIGNGHVMRCLTLAEELKNKGAEIIFISRNWVGNLLYFVQNKGYTAFTIETLDDATRSNCEALLSDWQSDAIHTIKKLENKTVDLLVVDHYGLDHQWETQMRSFCNRLMVIDDLANRQHNCNLLLDQNPGRSHLDYQNLIRYDAKILAGTDYALIRREFVQSRSKSLEQRKNRTLKKILVSMGGVDLLNASAFILHKLNGIELNFEIEIDVVVGLTSPWLQNLKDQAMTMKWPTHIISNSEDMASLLLMADIAIGAAGTSSLERCCMGLPTIQFALVNNQKNTAQELERQNAAATLDFNHFSSSDIKQLINQLSNPIQLSMMQEQASGIVDGNGPQRVAQEILHAY